MTHGQMGRLELLVGAFVVAGVIVISGLIVIFSGGVGGFFGETYTVVVELEHIGQLQAGAPVKLGGFVIGQVSAIKLEENNDIFVALDINKGVRLARDCEGMIAGAGLVGDTFIEIKKGKLKEHLNQDIKDFETARKPDQNLIKGQGPVAMETLFRRVDKIGEEVTGLLKHINEIVGDEKFKQNIKDIAQNGNRLTVEAQKLMNSVQRTSRSIELASKNVLDISEQVKGMTTKAEAALDQTFLDPKNIAKFNATLDNVKKISDSIASESDNIKTSIANVKEVTAKVKEIVSAMGPDKGIMPLFTSEKIKKELDRGLTYIKDVTSHEGLMTLMQLNRLAGFLVDKWLKENRASREKFGPIRDKLLKDLREGRLLGTEKDARKGIRERDFK